MKKTIFSIMTILMMMGIVSANVSAAVKTNEPAPDFSLTDTNNQVHNLSDFKGKYVVLEWVNYDCPFVKKHYMGGNMQQLQNQMAGKDVVWLSINSSAEGKQGNYPAGQVNEIIGNAEAKPTAYLQDSNGEVGKLYGAKTTPHMYVINPEGTLIYQGAIDDTPSTDPSDIKNSQNYVTLALEEAMAGKALSIPATKSYGCSVKY